MISEKNGFRFVLSRTGEGELFAYTVFTFQDHTETITVLDNGKVGHKFSYPATGTKFLVEGTQADEDTVVVKTLRYAIEEHKKSRLQNNSI